MTMGLQIVSIIGNATKDAEVKISKDGASYVTFRIAVSGRDESTTFYNVLVFGHYGEAIKDQITRGRQVFVNGKLQISEKGYVSVIADHIELLAKPKLKTKTEEEKAEEKTKIEE
jgi:single-stranded DNA-binding protein